LKRGEIWTAASGPGYVGNPRPVVIVQDDAFSETESVTVCPITSHKVGTRHARPQIDAAAETGLRETSFAMVDKITTVARTRLGKRIGALTAAQMTPIDRAAMLFLGLVG
jgi:mRNA interferase MazF